MPDSFDPLAGIYAPLERFTFGPVLQDARTAFLPRLASCQRLLCLGEGTGRFLVPVLRRYPDMQITVVENSPAMIREARKHLNAFGLKPDRVDWKQADVLDHDLSPSPEFEGVASHFFLDCFRPDEIDRIVENVGAACRPGARWLIADFLAPEKKEAGHRPVRQHLQAGMIRSLYAFFRATTGITATRIHDPETALSAKGFVLLEEKRYLQDLLWSCVFEKKSGS